VTRVKGAVMVFKVKMQNTAQDSNPSDAIAQQDKACFNGDATGCKSTFSNNTIENIESIEIY
jgi:hypothetical protein